jgi:hypothetical protein
VLVLIFVVFTLVLDLVGNEALVGVGCCPNRIPLRPVLVLALVLALALVLEAILIVAIL